MLIATKMLNLTIQFNKLIITYVAIYFCSFKEEWKSMNNKLSDVESKLAVYTAKLEESQNREATITVNMHFCLRRS